MFLKMRTSLSVLDMVLSLGSFSLSPSARLCISKLRTAMSPFRWFYSANRCSIHFDDVNETLRKSMNGMMNS